ncbi:hypothetical protein Lepto1489_14965 [Leptospira interrogans serovar Bataviae]|uniref:Uncharacterized protein n=1 Tax=Leptospira interrogans serovar Bataviae TaxID=312175 RepID=A0AAQ0B3Q0_LEPIR|nr:hypothetical protein Lepto1489_08175 [Leptospira interrogans serovar Bataviae]QOI52593.1 hypothetical protein Lepto1489_14965 [Leptospira interrogans serovar Bataviae]
MRCQGRAPAKLFSLFSAGSRSSLQSAKHHVKLFVYSNFRILFMVHCSIYASIDSREYGSILIFFT